MVWLALKDTQTINANASVARNFSALDFARKVAGSTVDHVMAV